MKKISIIIVNYNCENFIVSLLENLNYQTMSKDQFEVICVNNNQNNLLTELCSSTTYDFNLQIINNPYNYGYGIANNIGVKQAIGEYVFILNPDTQLQETNYLDTIYNFAKQNPQYGIISSKLINQDGYDASVYGKSYPNNIPIKNLPGDIAALIGAVMLIKRALFIQIHGFDPDFFLYEEDTDICLRVRMAGFSIYRMKDLTVVHIGGVSERKTDYYVYTTKKKRAILLFIMKHDTPERFNNFLIHEQKRLQQKKTKTWVKIYLLLLRHRISRYQQICAELDAVTQTIASTNWLYSEYKNIKVFD